ncbi:hypothetical protein [Spiroplasma floricola]|uniref:Uncharacterized protein n=1 Tax=Spiroplasma floricola 23-6 TaxID=1336749 RepID=A0A2K8SEV0_9MOLU|nr:hypothetical protein [Spiroplasma floricola]AUB31943.1 hypothetical protein SFLOR_v1c08950 [Spiroplasma floricola 23-6]
MNSFFKKINKNKTFFSVMISSIIILLLVFCLFAIAKICITKSLVISNYNMLFGLFNLGFFVAFIYGYKLFNYFKTVSYVKKMKFNQNNNHLFNDLIKKIRVYLNPGSYLVLFISCFIIFISVISQGKAVKTIEMSGIIFIKKLILSLISFAFFEFISIFIIFNVLKLIKTNKKVENNYVKKISKKLYFIFIKFINFLSIKFSEIKELILNIYNATVKQLYFYDSNQKNRISAKRSDFLSNQLKGKCPPVSILIY